MTGPNGALPSIPLPPGGGRSLPPEQQPGARRRVGPVVGPDDAAPTPAAPDAAVRPAGGTDAPTDGAPDSIRGRTTIMYEPGNNARSIRWLTGAMGANRLAGLFRRADDVVMCSRIGQRGYIAPRNEDDENGPATLAPLSSDALLGLIVQEFHVWRPVREEMKEMMLPAEVARVALATARSNPQRTPRLREIRGVTHTPMVRADGSVLGEPGYDDASRFLYLPDVAVPPVPEAPSRDELGAATAFLRNLVAEFRWGGPHDEANYLGLLLTPLLRELCPPPYKLASITARQPGSGKSLLATVLRTVHGGVLRAEMPPDDAELEKVLPGILRDTTAPVITFDNVGGVIRSSKLAGLLTGREFSGRILGSTSAVQLLNDRLWTITGNNVGIGGDLARRTLWVTIDPGIPDPHTRTGFAIPHLARYVAAHRGAILHALLTWVRAWVVAGRPAVERSSDDYASWSATVRGILQVAGVPGEFDHPETAWEIPDVDADEWGAFLTAAWDSFGNRPWTGRELLARVHDGRPSAAEIGHAVVLPPGGGGHYDAEHPIPLEALPGDLAERASRGSVAGVGKSLGRRLRREEGRWYGDLTVRNAGKRDGTILWAVHRHGAAG